MTKIVVAWILILAISGFCQTAKVVQLSDQDAQQVQTAKAALDKAQAAWDALRLDIEHRYVSDEQEVTSSLTVLSGSGLAIDSHVDSTAHNYLRTGADGTLTWQSLEEACLYVASGSPKQGDIDLCRKLLDLRAKSKAEQDAEEAREKERLAKLPKTITYTRKAGWVNGFEFSEDLRFLVPKASQPAADCSITPGGYLKFQ